MGRCVVPLCMSRDDEKTGRISFHRFPTNPLVRAEWVDNIGRSATWKPAQGSRVCSLHFTPESFSDTSRLRPNALPTVSIPTHEVDAELYPTVEEGNTKKNKTKKKVEAIVTESIMPTDPELPHGPHSITSAEPESRPAFSGADIHYERLTSQSPVGHSLSTSPVSRSSSSTSMNLNVGDILVTTVEVHTPREVYLVKGLQKLQRQNAKQNLKLRHLRRERRRLINKIDKMECTIKDLRDQFKMAMKTVPSFENYQKQHLCI